MDLRFKDSNITRHDALMPGFAKSSMNARLVSGKLKRDIYIYYKMKKSSKRVMPNKESSGPRFLDG